MKKSTGFKWKHDEPETILLVVRWYLRYNLSFRDLLEIMEERGLTIGHITIVRWVHPYGPELDKRVPCYLKQMNDFWRVDETYVRVKGQWIYLYRVVDPVWNTVNFYLSKNRNSKLVKCFFKKDLAFSHVHVSTPRVMTVGKNPAYPAAVEALKIMITEAMKMETTVQAPFSGTVTKIYLQNGEAISTRELLIELELEEQRQKSSKHRSDSKMVRTVLRGNPSIYKVSQYLRSVISQVRRKVMKYFPYLNTCSQACFFDFKRSFEIKQEFLSALRLQGYVANENVFYSEMKV